MGEGSEPQRSETFLDNIVDEHGRLPAPARKVGVAEGWPVGARFAELLFERSTVPIFPEMAVDVKDSLPEKAYFPIILSDGESFAFVGY